MKAQKRKNGTKTSSFGSPGRINHDSSSFYSSRLYEGLLKENSVKYTENEIAREFLNKIIPSSSENMKELP
ncbi:MAG: site-specific DNA-methyltransferase, partial [Thermoanaerobaculaceae bacterium]|nr:site-specific DNA-methyltransferase [Thermoanaerobaculaceae bacterium]